MSLNLELGQAGADAVVTLVTERDVDVLALQEVDQERWSVSMLPDSPT